MSAGQTNESPAPQPKRSYLLWVIGIVIVAIILLVFVVPPLTVRMRMAGKAQLTLEPQTATEISSDTMAELARVLQQRADLLGLEGTYVHKQDNRVIIAFKPVDDLDAVVAALSKRGDFNIYAVPEGYSRDIQLEQIYLVGPDGERAPAEDVLKDVEPIVRRKDLRTEAKLESDLESGRPVLRVFLDTPADRALAAWYAGHKGSDLAIAFDRKVISVAPMTGPIQRHINIQGIFTREEVNTMVACLRTDPLPIDVRALAPRLP